MSGIAERASTHTSARPDKGADAQTWPGRTRRILLGLMAVALAVPLASYAYLGRFSRYAADDYCTAGQLAVNGLLGMQGALYHDWSGRFSFTFLVGLLEVIGPSVVMWLPLAAVVGWVAAQAWVFSQKTDKASAVALALVLVYATLSSTPDLGQSLLWQTGVLTYVLPLILAAVFDGALRTGNLAVAAVLALAIGGTSETSVAVLIAALGMASAGAVVLNERRAIPYLGAGLVGAAIAFVIVIAAPGNAVRQSGNVPNLPFAIGAALDDLRQFFHDWWRFTTPSFLAALLLPAAIAFLEHKHLTKRQTVVLLSIAAACFVLVYVALLPSFYALGAPSPGRSRVIPQFFMALATGLVGYAAGGLLRYRMPATVATAMAGVVVVALLFFGPVRSTGNALAMAAPGQAYAAGWDQVDQQIRTAKTTGNTDVRVPHQTMDGTIRGMDGFSRDPNDWLNGCAARYYGVKTIVAE